VATKGTATISAALGGVTATAKLGVNPVATQVAMTANHSYSPITITVPAGTVIEFINPDTRNHTVTSDTGQSGLDSAGQYPNGMPNGSTFLWTVPAAAKSGTVYYYHCVYHGAAGNGKSLGAGMAGSIVVK